MNRIRTRRMIYQWQKDAKRCEQTLVGRRMLRISPSAMVDQLDTITTFFFQNRSDWLLTYLERPRWLSVCLLKVCLPGAPLPHPSPPARREKFYPVSCPLSPPPLTPPRHLFPPLPHFFCCQVRKPKAHGAHESAARASFSSVRARLRSARDRTSCAISCAVSFAVSFAVQRADQCAISSAHRGAHAQTDTFSYGLPDAPTIDDGVVLSDLQDFHAHRLRGIFRRDCRRIYAEPRERKAERRRRYWTHGRSVERDLRLQPHPRGFSRHPVQPDNSDPV